MTSVLSDFKNYLKSMKGQDIPFYMGCAYIVFTYVRPQAIYPMLDILPWTQLSILIGLSFSKKGLQIRSSALVDVAVHGRCVCFYFFISIP